MREKGFELSDLLMAPPADDDSASGKSAKSADPEAEPATVTSTRLSPLSLPTLVSVPTAAFPTTLLSFLLKRSHSHPWFTPMVHTHGAYPSSDTRCTPMVHGSHPRFTHPRFTHPRFTPTIHTHDSHPRFTPTIHTHDSRPRFTPTIHTRYLTGVCFGSEAQRWGSRCEGRFLLC